MDEVWKSIKDYDGLYEVSNLGRVRNCRTGRVLKPNKINNGYLQVGLYKDNVVKTYYVHRLVAEAFILNPNNKPQVNHKDKNPTNNRVENLEWCDCPYNINYSLAKTVYMYTQDDKLCGMWPSTAECGRNGFHQGHIGDCCNGNLKTHKGFKWSYEPPKPLLALPFYQF